MRISDWSSDVCSSDLKWPNFNVNDIVPSDRQPNQSIIRPMFWIGFEAVTAEAPGTGRECRPIGDHSGHGAAPLGRAAGKSRGRGDRKSTVQGKRVSVRVDHGSTRILKNKPYKTIIKQTIII